MPRRMCAWLASCGHDALHTLDLPLGNRTPDEGVTERADLDGRVLVTKDDFALRYPRDDYQLVWLRCGNITNKALREWLELGWPRLLEALEAGEQLIEIQ